MLNKKRLAMMAVAASMMLPTNLAYLYVATPVVAAENTELPGNPPEGKNVIELTESQYTLTKDTTLDYPLVIPAGKNVTLDLGTYTLTLADPANATPLVVKGNLTIEGTNGTINTVTPSEDRKVMINVAENGNLTVESGVTLEAADTQFGNAIGITDKNTIVTIKGATVKGGSNGIWISGTLKEDEVGTANGPKVYVKEDSKIIGGETGIYQAGYATEVVVNGAEVTGTADCGIEIRGGNLTVKGGSKVFGDMKPDTTSSSIKAYGNTGGAAIENAGIAIAQHSTKQKISVTIEGKTTEISGCVALAVLDPLGNQAGKTDLDKDTFTISVEESKLTGAVYDVVYSDDTIPFILTDVTLPNGGPTKLELGTNKENKVCTVTLKESEPLKEVPYTIATTVNEEDKNSTLVSIEDIKAAKVKENGEEVVPVKLGNENGAKTLNLPITSFQEDEITQPLTLETLSNAVTKLMEKGTVNSDGQEIKPNYSYSISGLKSVGVSKEGIILMGDEIALDVEIQNNSKIRLTTEDDDTPATPGSGEGDTPATPVAGEGDTPATPVAGEGDTPATPVAGEGDTPATPVAGEGEKGAIPMAELGEEDDTEPSTSIDTYVNAENLSSNGTVTKEAINNYLKTTTDLKDLEVDDDDVELPLDQPFNTEDVEIDDNGFIVIKLKKASTEEPEDPNPAPVTPTTTGGGNKKPKPKPEEPTEPTTPVGTPTTMYRLYNKLTGEHLYTIDKNERDNLLTSDTWKDEGQGWIAPSVSDYPVYRLLNPNNGDHHYTTDKNEFDTLPTYGWVAEGVAFFSADKNNTENVILHRLYNPNAEGAGSHHYTADTNERDALVAQGWKYEGTAWAGLPASK